MLGRGYSSSRENRSSQWNGFISTVPVSVVNPTREHVKHIIDGALKGNSEHVLELKRLAESAPHVVAPHVRDEHMLHFLSEATRIYENAPYFESIAFSLFHHDPQRFLPVLHRAQYRHVGIPKKFISEIYSLTAKGRVPIDLARQAIHNLMETIYRVQFSRDPPSPANPPLPSTHEHPEYRREFEADSKTLAENKAITKFFLRLTPKDPFEWVRVRIRASDDCTVPGAMHPGFQKHAVPYYFSRNGANYEILAEHYDSRSRGKGVRLRRNRHVGNVYLSEILHNGERVLYVSGLQLGDIYKTKHNVWVGESIVKGLRDLAKKMGYSAIWLNSDLLSHYPLLTRAAARAALGMGGKVFIPKKESLDYLDLPEDHYAAPHTSRVVSLRVK